MTPHIVIVANKWWEAVALVSVLEHARDIKPEFSACPEPFATIMRRPPHDCSPRARLICKIDEMIVEVLCLEDLIPEGSSTSSSRAKQLVLESLVARGSFKDAIAIAFGTAASPLPCCAGNVVVGSSVFVFDASEQNDSTERAAFSQGMGEIIGSSVGTSVLENSGVDRSFEEAQMRFLSPPCKPSPKPRIIAGPTSVSVGVVNVLHSESYREVDLLSLKGFASVNVSSHEAQSVETTHGLIRLCVDRPFIYVSGIANQVGRFDDEVRPRKYAQNYSASHNAAVCLAWMLPYICGFWRQNLSGR